MWPVREVGNHDGNEAGRSHVDLISIRAMVLLILERSHKPRCVYTLLSMDPEGISEGVSHQPATSVLHEG